MKNQLILKTIAILIMVFFISLNNNTRAQEANEDEEIPDDYLQYMMADDATEKFVRRTFNAPLLMNSQTNEQLNHNTLEFLMQHRFGIISSSLTDFYGLYAPANVRMGLAYGITEWAMVSVGITKFNNLQDFGYKFRLLRQTESSKMPVSVSLYGNMAIESGLAEDFDKGSHRISYFNQVIIARKFGYYLSLYLSPGFVHYNIVDSTKGYEHDNFTFIAGGKVTVSPQASILFEYGQGQLFSKIDDEHKAKPGISLGIEFATTAHSFQIFASSYRDIIEQRNYIYNTNNFWDGQILLGFNITRNWNF